MHRLRPRPKATTEPPRATEPLRREETGGVPTPTSRAGRVLSGLWREPTPLVGLVIIAVVALVALLAPWLAPHDPMEFLGDRSAPPSGDHLLGTDRLGRDLLSRIIVGARISFGTALVAATLITLLGVLFGSIAGYFGGWLDAALMRTADVILAFPTLILALVVAGLFEAGLFTVILILAGVWWVPYARIVRGLVLSVREWQFVEAARAVGAGHTRVLVRHVLPQTIPPVIVLATLEMGTLILALAGLNFLGLGVQPPTPEWGAMVNDGRDHFFSAPHLILVPGVAIGLTVLGFNLLGDGLRDALDPRLAGGLRRRGGVGV